MEIETKIQKKSRVASDSALQKFVLFSLFYNIFEVDFTLLFLFTHNAKIFIDSLSQVEEPSRRAERGQNNGCLFNKLETILSHFLNRFPEIEKFNINKR